MTARSLENSELHMGVGVTVVAAVDSAVKLAREVSILGFRVPTAEHVCDGKHWVAWGDPHRYSAQDPVVPTLCRLTVREIQGS